MHMHFIAAVAVITAAMAAVIPLSPEQRLRLDTWKPEDEGYPWEFSGQYEGDIILTKNQQKNGLRAETKRWPHKTIVYEFHTSVSEKDRTRITDAIQYFPQNTCVQVKERTFEIDYVNITAEKTGCHSYVGRKGGPQNLNLMNPGCTSVGTTLHEFLHALGFYHMQSAHNRDDYVDILFENIQDGKESNFRSYDNDTVSGYGETYDYKSVMHYSEKAFSKNGQPTIKAKDGTSPLGNREGLTETDRVKLMRMYECNEV